jgi:hypothetical protein
MFFNPTPKRSSAQRTLTVLAALLLFSAAGLFFTACPMEDDDETKEGADLPEKLIGTWKSVWNGGYDTYELSKTRLTYSTTYDGGEPSINYAGRVVSISEFTATAGVIIIKYDDDHKNKYYSDLNHYGDPAYLIEPPGDYVGIYYEELTVQSVKMGTAVGPDYGPPEKATLKDAKAAFTEGMKGDYVPMPGTYLYQQ